VRADLAKPRFKRVRAVRLRNGRTRVTGLARDDTGIRRLKVGARRVKLRRGRFAVTLAPRKRVRLLAVANVRDGMTVEGAARAGGMGRATLYRWLARERTGGAAALGDHPRSGRRRKLDAEQRAEVKAWVLAGPDVERDGVVAWRGGDARAMVERRFGVKLALSSTYRLLRELHLSALLPRPRHSDADPAAQTAFQQTSRPA